MVNHSLVNSRIQYGITVWGTANQTHLECLRVRLNEVLRIILSCGIEAPINKMYSTLQFLKIDDIYQWFLNLLEILNPTSVVQVCTEPLVITRSGFKKFWWEDVVLY